MRFFYRFVVLMSLQIVLVCSIGQFYVGLLGYQNNNIDPRCCASKTCASMTGCSLMFVIEVDGLNSSLGPVSRRPSELVLTPAEAEAFQGDSVTNPLSFQFNKWPGRVDVTVYALDGESDTLVDQFNYTVSLFEHSDYYFRIRLTDETSNASSLIIVFRYECGATKGPSCFTDCVDHMMNETCPVTPYNATELPTDVITFTGLPNRKCETTDADGNVLQLNCSSGSPTTTESAVNETTATSSSTSMTSSDRLITSPELTSTSQPVSTTSETRSEKQSDTTLAGTSSTKSSFENKSTHAVLVTTNPNDTNDPNKGTSSPTTPSEGVPTLDNSPTAYWPGIVGGVLGGVAVLAASAFICYWNRQKKLQKRQEIYNVNPKILRNFEEFEENGTSGRSDVPMETEQY